MVEGAEENFPNVAGDADDDKDDYEIVEAGHVCRMEEAEHLNL